MVKQRSFLLGVLLTSLVTLAIEIILTRVFSVTMWYHFAFLTISIALMGSATAGVVVYLRPQMLQETAVYRWIGIAAIAFTLAVPLTLLVYLRIPSIVIVMNRTESLTIGQILYLALVYILLSIPFFLSGVVISLALAGWAKIAGRIYWADLTGAALGCLVSVLVLQYFGAVNAVFAVAILMGIAALVFNWEQSLKKARLLSAVGVLLFATVLFVTNMSSSWVQIRVSKGEAAEPTVIFEKWNVHSRVTVYEEQPYPFFWAISDAKWEEVIAQGGEFPHSLLLIDAVAGTPIQKFTGDFYQVGFLRNDLTAIAYHLIENPETLVIGPGGGRDVLTALTSGAPHVTAVEVNPAIIAAVKGPFAEFAGNLYTRPDVEVHVADARGFIERSPNKFDVIQASLIDTWAAGGSGAFALSENSLYTREAFQSYYDHLTDDGMITVSRWYLPDRPAETMRLVSTAIAGLEAAGVANPREHIAVVAHFEAMAQTEGLSTTLLKHEPFTPEDVAKLQETAESLGYTVIYAFGEPESVGYVLSFTVLVIGLGALEGAIVGAAQAIVLRRRLPQLRTWVAATMAGAVVAWTLGMLPGTLMSLVGSDPSATPSEMSDTLQVILAIPLGLLAGAILGFPQWLILKRYISLAGWWVVANALAWACGMPLVFVVASAGSTEGVLSAVVTATIGLATAGALVGGIHGAFLVRLLAPLKGARSAA